MAAGYDGTIRIDSSIDGKGFNAGVKNLMGSLKGLAAAVGVAFGVGAVVAFGKSAVDAASQMQGAFIGLKSVMDGQGKSFSQAKGFITSFIADGLVPATNAVAAYKNLAMRGYDTSQIEKTMIALKDASAFGRQASLTMGQAVQSATEGLKNENSILVDNAGVTKNVSLMWKDYAASIGTTAAALTKEQKIQAEVAGIMAETRFQTGDAGKLAGTYAGQLSALGVSFLNLQVAVGNAIIPIISKILPYIKMAIDALVIFFNQVAQIISFLFGTEIPSSAATTEAAMSGVADSTDAASAAQGDLAKNTSKAGKAAKGALAAFDQLNVLQTADASSAASGSGAGVGGAGGGLTLPARDTSAIDQSLEALKAKVAAWKADMITFFQPVTDAFDRLVVALTPLGETIWAGLKWAWDNILVPLGTWVITDALPVFLDGLGATATLLNDVLIAVGPAFDWLWKNFLEPAASFVGTALLDYFKWCIDNMKELHLWISNNRDTFQALLIVLAIAALLIFALVSPVGLVIAAIVALIVIIANWGVMWDWIKRKTEEVAAAIGNAWGRWLDWIGAKADDLWETMKMVWAIAGWWFENNVTLPIQTAFDKALTWVRKSWEDTFTGIQGFVKNTVNTIIDFMNGMIRAIASGINTVISGLNSIKVSVPSWVPGYGGSSWGMNLARMSVPQIPRLATGAVIPPNAQFAAILGDQKSGTNIEAPEGLIRKIIKEEIGGIKADITINFAGSLAGLMRELKPYLDQENVRIGKSLIQGGTIR